MSKLETAFSKAMREQSARSNSDSSDKQSGGEEGVLPLNHSNTGVSMGGLKDLAQPSKNLIRDMALGKQLTDEELAKKHLIYPRMKDKNLLNIYRNLRTKLLATCPKSNFLTLVTSVVPLEESALVTANIAATFAFDEGKTALLIEGNVQVPTLKKIFELEDGAKGLMDYIESDSLSVGDILCETGIPRLRFVPAGKYMENSAEYFTSKKMEQAISELRERYPERYPIINAPSIPESADTRILLDLCDYAILIVPYGKCTENQIRNAALTIGKEKLIGVVLNEF